MSDQNVIARDVSQSTRSSLPQSDLAVLLAEANVATRRLARRFRLAPSECDDVRQDFLVDLLGRVKAFDRNRGTFGAFVGTVVAHRAKRLANRIRREQATPWVWLDELLGEGVEKYLNDAIAETSAPSSRASQPIDRNVERRIDLGRALEALGSAEIKLCVGLVDSTPTELSRAGGESRASIYRRIKEIRCRMIMSGVSGAA